MIYVAFGDSDEFAHAGDCAHYLAALERGDEYLREIWERLQADPFYKGQTTLFVSTDHGRGDKPIGYWRDHASQRYFDINPKSQPEYNGVGVPGSANVFMAALGPAVKRAGAAAYRGGACAYSQQIAASALTALGLDWRAFATDIGEPLAFIDHE